MRERKREREREREREGGDTNRRRLIGTLIHRDETSLPHAYIAPKLLRMEFNSRLSEGLPFDEWRFWSGGLENNVSSIQHSAFFFCPRALAALLHYQSRHFHANIASEQSLISFRALDRK